MQSNFVFGTEKMGSLITKGVILVSYIFLYLSIFLISTFPQYIRTLNQKLARTRIVKFLVHTVTYIT